MTKKKKTYQVQDKFFQKAKADGYRARSAYKLEELHERFKIFKPGQKVLDLGAAPGSFMQYAASIVGEKGMVVGVDLKPIDPFKEENIQTMVGDMYDEELNTKIVQEFGIDKFDVIISDLAPAITGIKNVDAARSFELNSQVLEVSKKLLKTNGNVIMKFHPGIDESELIKKTKDWYKSVKKFVPSAVRASSREVYVIGFRKRSEELER